MTSHAVLDACVLIPMPLADTLLQLAEAGHYHPTWSAALLEETRRNLASKMGLHPGRAARRIELMRLAFPWAEADPPPDSGRSPSRRAAANPTPTIQTQSWRCRPGGGADHAFCIAGSLPSGAMPSAPSGATLNICQGTLRSVLAQIP